MGDTEDIKTHIPRLRRYARALTGDRFSADDLVQDTLERAWGRFRLWRRGTRLRAWLFTIMHNLYVNQTKRSYEKRHVSLEDGKLELPVRATQDEWLELRDLAAAVQRLPIEQREVLMLVAVEQMPYEEVACVLGIPVGTVMSRLSRGREKLRALIKGAAPQQLKVVK